MPEVPRTLRRRLAWTAVGVGALTAAVVTALIRVLVGAWVPIEDAAALLLPCAALARLIYQDLLDISAVATGHSC